MALPLFIIGNAYGSNDTIVFKPYAVQFRFLSAFLDQLPHDSASAMSMIDDLRKKGEDKGDLRLKYGAELTRIRYMDRHERRANIENDLGNLLSATEKHKLVFLKAEILHTLSNFQWRQKKYTTGLEYGLRAYEQYKKFPFADFPLKADCLYDLGSRYYYFRDFYTAKRYFLEALPVLVRGVNGAVSKLNTLGLCYRNIDMFDSAGYYLNKARLIAEADKDMTWIALLNGNLGAIYAQLGEHEKAIPLLETDVALSLKQNELSSAARAMATLSTLYLAKNEPHKARQWAERSLAIIYQREGLTKELPTVKVAYAEIAKVFAATGETARAYRLMDSSANASNLIDKERNLQYLAGVKYKLDAERHLSELRLKEAEIGREKLIRNGFLTGLGAVLLFSVALFFQKKRIVKQKKISDDLLRNILPQETAEELKRTGTAKAKNYDSVTVLFTDFKNFTALSATLTAEQLVQEINYYYSQFDQIIAKHNLEKIKTIGDSYMCAGGLPVATKTHAVDVIYAAMEMIAFVDTEKIQRQNAGRIFLEMRLGVNTGAVIAGIVGIKKFTYDIWGDTVNIASRMESAGVEGMINISESTYLQVKDRFHCIYRGEIESKNNHKLKMYFVEQPGNVKLVRTGDAARQDEKISSAINSN